MFPVKVIKLKVIHIHKSLLLELIMSQFSPVHALTPNMHSNIILSPTLRFPKWPIPIRFLDKILCFPHLLTRATCPIHISLLY